MRVSRAQIQKLEKSGRLTISKPAAKPPPAISEQEIEKIAEAVSQKAKKDDVTGTQTFRFSNERDQDGRLTAVLANAADGSSAYHFVIDRSEDGAVRSIRAEALDRKNA